VPVPCPAPYIILRFALVSRMLKKKSFGIQEHTKMVAAVGVKEREQEGRGVRQIAPPMKLSPAHFSFLSFVSKSLLEPIQKTPRALLLQPMRGPGGSSVCLLLLISCGSVMKLRSQLRSASPTDSLLALGQIHNFCANSSSAKTPNSQKT